MNLSIFSSENIKKYRSIPPSEKRWHVGVIVLFVFLFNLGHGIAKQLMELEHRYGPNAHMAAAWEALSEQTQVIFLGCSHIISGIRPDLFSVESMNIAGTGFDYSILEKILRKYLDSIPNLNLAVIELDPVPLLFHASLHRIDDFSAFYAWGLDRIDVGLESQTVGEKVSSFMSDMLVPKYRLTPKSVVRFFLRGRFSSSPEKCKVIPGYRAWDQVLQADGGIPKRIAWLAERFSAANMGRNRRALRHMIDLLLEHEVQIVFFQLPHHASYSSNIPYSWRQTLKETEIELQTIFKFNIPFWDYEESTAFDETHFKDSVHLNSSGAAKLSALLNQRISTFMELPSRGRMNSSRTDRAEKSE